ncbi:hypothetical protein BGW38_007489, partial [Lunasporangiospora selenospora]
DPAAASSSSSGAPSSADASLSRTALKNKKKRENAKNNNNNTPSTPARSNTPRPTANGNGGNKGGNKATASNANGALIPAGASGQMTDTEKKIRNVTKKLKQIHELKEKQAAGEILELTQLQKIAAEASLLKELEALKI